MALLTGTVFENGLNEACPVGTSVQQNSGSAALTYPAEGIVGKGMRFQQSVDGTCYGIVRLNNIREASLPYVVQCAVRLNGGSYGDDNEAPRLSVLTVNRDLQSPPFIRNLNSFCIATNYLGELFIGNTGGGFIGEKIGSTAWLADNQWHVITMDMESWDTTASEVDVYIDDLDTIRYTHLSGAAADLGSPRVGASIGVTSGSRFLDAPSSIDFSIDDWRTAESIEDLKPYLDSLLEKNDRELLLNKYGR